jgi:zinc protease
MSSTLVVPRERFELEGGLTLLVSPRSGASVTAARLHLRGGSALDPEGRDGTGFLVGRLADQGTANMSEADLAESLEPRGGSLSGDATGLAGSIAGSGWKLLLEKLFDLARNAAYPKAAVDVQLRRVLSRLSIEREDPRSQAGHKFRKLIYGDHWLGRSAHGTFETVETITARHLREHHRKNWHPSRMTLAICGDVDPQAVRRVVSKCIKGWAAGPALIAPKPKIPKMGVRVDAFSREREQVHLFLGHLGVLRANPDWPALVVMDHVLGSGPGFTSRITKRLRDELGLAYSVHADVHASAGRQPGMFRAYIGTSPEHVGTAIQGFLVEMSAIRKDGVTKEELTTAKSYLLGSFALGYERASRRAAHLIASELHGFGEDHLDQLSQAYRSITADDVQRVAETYLHPDACCVVGAGPVTKKELVAALA